MKKNNVLILIISIVVMVTVIADLYVNNIKKDDDEIFSDVFSEEISSMIESPEETYKDFSSDQFVFRTKILQYLQKTENIVGSMKNISSSLSSDADSKKVIIDIACKSQFPDYPTGCETVSSWMVLNYYGFYISVDDIIDKYLEKGTAPYLAKNKYYSSDPREMFLGDPRSYEGWGICAPGIEKTLNKYLKNTDYYVFSSYSYTLSELCEIYIDKQIPVLVWCTVDMQEKIIPVELNIEETRIKFKWNTPSHCAVLVGYDENNYYFNDPYYGKTIAYEKTKAEKAHKIQGNQSIVIYK